MELAKSNYDGCVMAHSHMASIETFKNNGKNFTYANAGSFGNDGAYIAYENGAFRLERYSAGYRPAQSATLPSRCLW